jgi:hypothetical protein
MQKQQGVQQQQTGLLRDNGVKAQAFIDSDGVTPVYFRQRGFAGGTAIVRNGAGDYTLTLSEPLDVGANPDRMIQLTVAGGALHGGSVEVASATTLRIRTYTVTAAPTVAAADLDFYITVGEIGPN